MGPAWVSGSLFANTFISFSGAGILGLPYAFQKAGLVEGTVILAVVCFVSIYAMLLLVRAKNKVGKGFFFFFFASRDCFSLPRGGRDERR